jgi:hypothetical protein
MVGDCKKWDLKKGNHVFEHCVHECDGDLGLLNEVVFCVLNFQPSMLLFLRAGVLETDSRSASTHQGERGSTHVCLAASNSSLLPLTDCLAFIATAMDVDNVVCHGCRKLSWIPASCSSRATEILSQPEAYNANALARRSSLPATVAWRALDAVEEERTRACGRVLCVAGRGVVGD